MPIIYFIRLHWFSYHMWLTKQNKEVRTTMNYICHYISVESLMYSIHVFFSRMKKIFNVKIAKLSHWGLSNHFEKTRRQKVLKAFGDTLQKSSDAIWWTGRLIIIFGNSPMHYNFSRWFSTIIVVAASSKPLYSQKKSN